MGAVLSLFLLCGWFGLLCPLWSGWEQKQGRIWRIGLWVTHRRLRCFETLATPAPQTDPAAALHYQIHLFCGPQRHVTKIQLMRSNPAGLFFFVVVFYVFIYVFKNRLQYLLQPHNPTLIENGIFFFPTAQQTPNKSV